MNTFGPLDCTSSDLPEASTKNGDTKSAETVTKLRRAKPLKPNRQELAYRQLRAELGDLNRKKQ